MKTKPSQTNNEPLQNFVKVICNLLAKPFTYLAKGILYFYSSTHREVIFLSQSNVLLSHDLKKLYVLLLEKNILTYPYLGECSDDLHRALLPQNKQNPYESVRSHRLLN